MTLGKLTDKPASGGLLDVPRNPRLRAGIIAALYPDALEIRERVWSIPCPGVHLHTLAPGTVRPGDCIVRDDDDEYRLPLLVCSHSHCREMVELARKTLNRAIYTAEAAAAGIKTAVKRAPGIALPCSKKMDLAALKAAEEDERILDRWRELAAAAELAEPIQPNALEIPIETQSRLMIDSLYSHADTIWMGTVEHGKPTAVEYLHKLLGWQIPLEAFIGMSRYNTGADRRLDKLVMDSPWIVLEADDARGPWSAREWACKVASALLASGFSIKMIVDSGGKSAHVWTPRAPFLARYQAGLTDPKRNKAARNILGIDPATLRIGQPVRLAGIQGDGRKNPAHLIYLSPP